MHALARVARFQLHGSRILRQHKLLHLPAGFRRSAVQAEAMSKQQDSSSSLLDGAKARVQAQLLLDKNSTPAATATSIHPVTASSLESFLQALNQPAAAAWASINKFKAKSGELLLLPSEQGGVSAALLGVGDSYNDIWAYAALPGRIPPGIYELALPEAAAGGAAADKALLGWLLGEHKQLLATRIPGRVSNTNPLPHCALPAVGAAVVCSF
jgi:hypothetical protein